jgi:cation-transporting ATPase E
MMQYYCPNCFTEISPEAQTCSECGTDIEEWTKGYNYTKRLIHALKHPQAEARKVSIVALGNRREATAAVPLAECALAFPSDLVQNLEVVRSLDKLPSTEAKMTALHRLADHPAHAVRVAAVDVLNNHWLEGPPVVDRSLEQVTAAPSNEMIGQPQVLGLTGLSSNEVEAQRAAGHTNKVELPTSRTYREILRESVFSFINGVFFVISLVLIVLTRWIDALTVLLIIGGGSSVNLYQEIRAKRKLDQIALLTRPKITVIRDGQRHNIVPDDIVLGDILLAEPGDQIVVDGIVVAPGQMDVDESLLTGESDLIPKQAGDEVHSGSFCVRGSAPYEANKIGDETLAYRLTSGARAFRRLYTPLQTEVNLIIQVLLLLAIFFWVVYGISYLVGAVGVEDGIQAAAVTAGLVPVGLYLAITLAYALGAVRLAGENAVIQQSNAVESLSHVDVLCFDKTGTLTNNQLDLHKLYPLGITEEKVNEILGDFAATVTTSNRTNEALREACPGTARPVQAEVPFSSVYKWSALVFDETTYVLGAPEILAEVMPVGDVLKRTVDSDSEQGLRVVLFASAPGNASLYNVETQPCLPQGLMPLALVTFREELRPNVHQTLQQFTEAGVAIKVISGDNPRTVAAVGRQAGLGSDIQVVSGLDLAKMDDIQFATVAQESTVFGRVSPEQKSRLIQQLVQQGNYVAMIGDGVNDVLSLKEANLSVAMESGSQVTRSAASIVLLEDTFGALPHALLEGQRIRNGVQDVMSLFMVRIFTFVLLIVAIDLVTDTFPLLIRHHAVITTLVVGIPTIGVAFWAEAGQPIRRSLIRSTLHFALPPTLTLALVGLFIYLGYLIAIVAITPVPEDVSAINIDELLPVPRSALVTILVYCGLLLLPFLKPPTSAWVGGQPLSGDWRYTLTALAMLMVYFIILAVPPFREFADLALLGLFDYLFLGMVALIWGIVVRTIWRKRLLDRFLGVDLS